ncbi:BZ3500_MvSof-1268-A1-R1_Chr11-2g03383 [Microbotryum saponariae]|uniref:BZ3500_MvSof-1268-A1-R1_Chr11-2g03383 protein n=1 Tax=Microbotryum saponariae TaxID=289078 RepID=A0A2X0L8V1_9BASI|nr:BZ3500_MvSof-1268-A1-R1_Chr11-2g03383 [Microbotryum saponariae]SDA03251.1 BZ3501_MvSof-1269-A2-R1_Chr11g02954 [Microbotryum saponariae]
MTIRLSPYLQQRVLAAASRLEINFDPRVGLARVQRYGWQWKRDWPYAFLVIVAMFSLCVMPQHILFKVFLVGIYTAALLVPFTSQFVLPATPIFGWLILFFSSQFIPTKYRPHIWVSVLPTLESVLYGANISDILTRYTSPFLDVLAWIPYGVVHFAGPFFVAAFLFVFSPPGALKFWGSAFGYLNLVGVMIQIIFPCAPPWYEIREGLIPANYGMHGSPGGLARIDAIFGGNGYNNTFTNAPVPFGAFPSLHAGCSTMEALFLSHFFPKGRVFYWSYVFWLYWSTMVSRLHLYQTSLYLTHHYLIDLVAGGSLACAYFYYYLARMPDELRHPTALVNGKFLNATPLDEEVGMASTMLNGNGYGGWDSIDEEEEEMLDRFGASANPSTSSSTSSPNVNRTPGGVITPGGRSPNLTSNTGRKPSIVPNSRV